MLIDRDRFEEVTRYLLVAHNAKLVKWSVEKSGDRQEIQLVIDAIDGMAPEQTRQLHQEMSAALRQHGFFGKEKFGLEIVHLTAYSPLRSLKKTVSEVQASTTEELKDRFSGVVQPIKAWWSKFVSGFDE